MKLKILLPLFFMAAEYVASNLEAKDENSTGVDDEIAAAIRHLVNRLREYNLNTV